MMYTPSVRIHRWIRVAEIAGSGTVAVVVDDEHRPTGIVTKIDLIDYLANKVR